MQRFNLNAFFALNAILNAPTLTEAGRSINLSQPAMSLALKRLREFFADELVRYEHGHAQLSPLALKLHPKVADILQRSRDVMEMSSAFDPATETRTLFLAAPQAVLHFFIPTLVARLAVDAPGIALDAIALSVEISTPRADILILPEWRCDPDEPSWVIFREEFACLVHSDLRPMRMEEQLYLASEHVALPGGQDHFFWPERTLAHDLLLKRHVLATVRKLDALPHLVTNRRLVATTTIRIAQQLAAMSPWTSVIAAPPALEPVNLVMQASSNRSEDPAVRWLISQIESAAAPFTPGGLGHLRRK